MLEGLWVVLLALCEEDETVLANAVNFLEEDAWVEDALAEAVWVLLRRVMLKRDVGWTNDTMDAEVVEITGVSVDTEAVRAAFAGAVKELATAVEDALAEDDPLRAPDLIQEGKTRRASRSRGKRTSGHDTPWSGRHPSRQSW